MHLFAQLAFSSALTAPISYLAGMNQLISRKSHGLLHSAVRTLGRGLIFSLMLLALISIGMVSCGGGLSDAAPPVQSSPIATPGTLPNPKGC